MSLQVRRESRSGPLLQATDGSIPLNSDLPGLWRNASGQPVTAELAFKAAAAGACVRYIADRIATAPRNVFRRLPGQTSVSLPTPSVIDDPWPEFDAADWWFAQAASMLLHGEAIGYVTTWDRLGFPATIEPVSRPLVGLRRLLEGPKSGQLEYTINGEVVPTDRVHHIRRAVLPGRLRGIGVIEANSQLLGLGMAAEEFVARFFGDGAHPTAVIEWANSDVKVANPDSAKRIKATVMRALRGSREPLILGAGATMKPWQATPADAGLMDIWNSSFQQMAMAFSLPPEVIGASSGNSMVYSNVEALQLRGDAQAVLPVASRMESFISSKWLPPPQHFRFDLDHTLRVDAKTRAEISVQNLRSGKTTPDEERALEDRPPLPAGAGAKANWPPWRVAPEIPTGETADPSEMDPSALAEMVQKLYLGTPEKLVISEDEAREILNRAGAGLTGPAPSTLAQGVADDPATP